jgi:hypothetical protein
VVDPVTFLASTVGQIFQQVVADLVVRGPQRQAKRGPEVTGLAGKVDDLARRLTGWRQAELSRLPDDEWEAAVRAVADALRAAAPLDVETVVAADADPRRFRLLVADRAAGVPRAAALSADAQAAYDRLLGETCDQVVAILRALPAFTELAQARVLKDIRQLDHAVTALPDRIERALDSDPAHADFTARYLEQVAGELGLVEVFGLNRGAPARHPLDRAYVPQAVARTTADDESDAELTGAGTDVLSGLADLRRALVRGGAGAGKTTLLRWLALQAARGRTRTGGSGAGSDGAGSDGGGSDGRGSNGGGSDGGGSDGARSDGGAAWPAGDVPFLVPLRRFASGELPPPERFPELLAEMIASETPPQWVSRQLRSGNAWILVDGVDELAPDRRAAAARWVEQLVRAYPEARYVVTTRPSAVPEDWLARSGFVPLDLLPMSANSTRAFLRFWHDAARADAGADELAQHWLNRCEEGLAEVLATRPELRRLAAVPLLCGLLCALYRESNMHLPHDRKGLYEAALDLLLVRWDQERNVPSVGPRLSKEEQTVLLQRFAYTLIKNNEVQVSREAATRSIGHAMKGMRSYRDDPTPIVQYLLERTGMLREPHPDMVQFVHRTFRDYLAAKEVVDSGDLKSLLEHAHLDSWHDVVVMAVAHARPAEREHVLDGLLAGNSAARRDRRVADQLHLVAAACLEQADVTRTGGVRAKVERAAARLIPPDNAVDAELLAKAGRFVLDLLPGPEGLSDAQAAAVVRTVALIGGEEARDKIALFSAADEAVVIDELLRAWRQTDDPEEYARVVLAGVNFGERRLDVRGWHRVQHLRYLTRLANVRCIGDLRPLDPFATIPNLHTLELLQNEVVRDLSPLARNRRLRDLRLTHCPLIRDLSPLARGAVERLSLHFVPADPGTLAGAPLRALTIRDAKLAGGLHAIPADLPLVELTLDNPEHARDLTGVGRWQSLEHVTVAGVPGAAELAELATLPRLRHLTIRRPEPADLGRLAALPGAYRLDLEELGAARLDSVLAAAPARPDLDLRLDGRPLRAHLVDPAS